MQNQYNVLIIGAGNIGAFFDEPDSEDIITHAHAFKNHDGFKLSGFIDTDESKASSAASIWGGEVFSSIEDAFKQEEIDIVCITVPDKFHYSILKIVHNFPVKFVFVEKPISKTLAEASEVLRIYNEKKIPVMVNYSRRFLSEFEYIKGEIDKGIFGNFVSGTGYYGKGLFHNGSHLINLLCYLIGDVARATSFGSVRDFYDDDESISAVLAFEGNSTFTLNSVDCNLYTIFEMDLLFEKKRIRIVDSGFTIEKYSIQKSARFKGYQNLVLSETVDTSFGKAMYCAVDNIYKHLIGHEEIKCSLSDGYNAMEICQMIRGKSE